MAIGAEIQGVAPQITEEKNGACVITERQLASLTEKLASLGLTILGATDDDSDYADEDETAGADEDDEATVAAAGEE